MEIADGFENISSQSYNHVCYQNAGFSNNGPDLMYIGFISERRSVKTEGDHMKNKRKLFSLFKSNKTLNEKFQNTNSLKLSVLFGSYHE